MYTPISPFTLLHVKAAFINNALYFLRSSIHLSHIWYEKHSFVVVIDIYYSYRVWGMEPVSQHADTI